jgi:hypothetical protein
LTSSAPATWKRSVMTVFISALSSIASRESPAGAADDAGRDDEQRQQRDREQGDPPLEASIAIRVTVTPMRLSTMPPSVPVSARCAPTRRC